MSNELVSVIIASAGRKDFLEGLLDSVNRQTYPNREVFVIDTSKENLSYCEALNKGINAAKGDFILCLNDDVMLEQDFIAEAVKVFFIDKSIGMASGKILRFDKTTIDSTGLFLSIWRTARERGYGIKDKGQFDKEGFVFGVTGAVAFYRKKMLEEAKAGSGYFDSKFRFFYEDLDAAWRAQKLGWKGYYTPSAVAYHLRGGTARQGNGINKRFARRYLSRELHALLIKNRYRAIIKNETALGFLLHLPFIILYDVFSWGYFLLKYLLIGQ